MAMVAMMTVASCDDSDDVDYSVDIQKVKNAMPGTWTITNWEVRQGTDPLDEVPTDLTNAKVEYSPHNLCRIGIDDPLLFVLGILHVSIRRRS